MKLKAVVTLLGLMFAALLPVKAPASSLVVKPEVALKQAFPQLVPDSMRESAIKGVYEVVSGQNVLYFYPEKDLLLVGEIYSKDGRNLTAERKGELVAAKIKDLPLDKAVKIGSGPKTVVEFTDPDCPYCRKASEFFKGRSDVTRYVFFSPFAHPQAITKVYYILAASDKAKAYEEMMQGKPVPAAEAPASEAVKALASQQLDLARSIGVQGTPTFFINGSMVVGADVQKIEGLLR
ncbi:MAG TPA: DsbC family protein [Geobacteraceae bacterium]